MEFTELDKGGTSFRVMVIVKERTNTRTYWRGIAAKTQRFGTKNFVRYMVELSMAQVANPLSQGLHTCAAIFQQALKILQGTSTLATLVGLTAVLNPLWVLRAAAQPSDEFARLMNIGKAHIENREAAKAIVVFESAVVLKPGSASALRNLARAYLAAQQPEKAETALKAINRSDADTPATTYLRGLIHMRQSKPGEAVPEFESAVRLDPRTSALRFQLANAYATAGEREKAEIQYRETVRLDPLHAAAQYRLATLARQSGNETELQERMREFTRLRTIFGDESRSPEALEACKYTQPEIPLAEGLERVAGKAIDVHFTDSTAETIREPVLREAAVSCLLDLDAQGRYTVFILDGKGGAHLLRFAPDGHVQKESAGIQLEGTRDFKSCISGDFHNDVPKDAKYDPEVHALNDVLLVGTSGVKLLRRKDPRAFEDVTEASGLKEVRARRAAWMDYEHDGDLDMAVAGASGLQIWQNQGDARFIEITASLNLGESGPSEDVAAADLDHNIGLDLVVARGAAPTLVFENKRVGLFSRLAEPPGPWPSASRVLLNDIDNDGLPDAVLLAANAAQMTYSSEVARQRIEFRETELTSAALVDYDNDGWLDLVLGGHRTSNPTEGVVRIWRNQGADPWKEVTDSLRLPSFSSAVVEIIAADFDGDADSDLLLLTAAGTLHHLRNDGGGRNGQIKLRLQGTKTNPAGIGTHVELRSGSYWVTRAVHGLPVELGLAGRKKFDSLQVLWTNGVVDNQIEFEPGDKPITFIEKNVATGSCPFLYAWDGRRFRFVTDLLGNSPVGLPMNRETLLPADPDEIVYIGNQREFPPREGHYAIEITSEFREVLYLDDVRLLAVDHSSESEVHPTDKLMPAPFPHSEVWELLPAATLRSAMGSDGLDRTEALRAIDGHFAPPGSPLPPPYRGMCQPLALTLDFEYLDPQGPLVLALTGWLQYGDGSTNIALSQDRSLSIIPPTVEVESSTGNWKPLDVVVGMPAGKTKTILCELKGLARPAQRVRLTTTFEIRWDRIALMRRPPSPKLMIHELEPSKSTLRWRGFSEIKSRAANHPSTPDFEAVLPAPPWRTTLQGWCTRYGDVLELVSKEDGLMAFLNGGDALSVEFAAAGLPPVPDDMVRSFFLYSVGWDKDGDHNVEDGDTVEPMPAARTETQKSLEIDSQSDIDENDWRIRYNTRWVPHHQFAPKRTD